MIDIDLLLRLAGSHVIGLVMIERVARGGPLNLSPSKSRAWKYLQQFH
jgi:hypothetical protein